MKLKDDLLLQRLPRNLGLDSLESSGNISVRALTEAVTKGPIYNQNYDNYSDLLWNLI